MTGQCGVYVTADGEDRFGAMDPNGVATDRADKGRTGLGAWPIREVNPYGRDARVWEIALSFEDRDEIALVAIAGSANFKPTDSAIADLVEDQPLRSTNEIDPLTELLDRREPEDRVILLRLR